jgi:mono/diheme cytochrome c family protein
VACGADVENATGPGGRTYLQQCSACHGANREGVGVSPALPQDRMVALGAAEVERITRDGGVTMQGFDGVLSDAEIDAVVAYLLTGTG